jgi:hypothetical protein
VREGQLSLSRLNLVLLCLKLRGQGRGVLYFEERRWMGLGWCFERQ